MITRLNMRIYAGNTTKQSFWSQMKFKQLLLRTLTGQTLYYIQW